MFMKKESELNLGNVMDLRGRLTKDIASKLHLTAPVDTLDVFTCAPERVWKQGWCGGGGAHFN